VLCFKQLLSQTLLFLSQSLQFTPQAAEQTCLKQSDNCAYCTLQCDMIQSINQFVNQVYFGTAEMTSK